MEETTQKTWRHDMAAPVQTLAAQSSSARLSASARRTRGSCFRICLGAVATGCLLPGYLMMPATAVAAQKFDASVVSDSGNYIVEYRTHPNPIPVNEMFEMRITVREQLKQSPARNVSLEVDAGMSVHNHGMNTKPVVERLPSGQFSVRGMLFHMTGRWELIFLIKRGIISDKAEQVVYIR